MQLTEDIYMRNGRHSTVFFERLDYTQFEEHEVLQYTDEIAALEHISLLHPGKAAQCQSEIKATKTRYTRCRRNPAERLLGVWSRAARPLRLRGGEGEYSKPACLLDHPHTSLNTFWKK